MIKKIERRIFIKKTSVLTFGLGASQFGLASVVNSMGPELILAQKGQIPVPIVLAADAFGVTIQAANELADYIAKITGTRPDVIVGTKSVPKIAIWVGIQPQVWKLFRDLDLEFKHQEEILITCNGKHLLIAGRDYFFKNAQIEYGTVNAVYTFLQKYLDIRWLWPGELGEDIIRKDTIAIPSFTYRFHPAFLKRSIFIRRIQSEAQITWTRFQRLKYDSLKGDAGGHAFVTWWDRFHKDHPEWFALQPDGTRSGYPDPRTVKMCLSNPEVWEQWLTDAKEALKKNPELCMIQAGENDNFSSGICVCESCRAWDHPEGAPWKYYWEGHQEDYVAMSNRYITFFNHVARKLKEAFPERDNLFVQALAYGPSTPPPVDIKLEDNIILSYVGKFPTVAESIPLSKNPEGGRQEQKAQFKAWSEHAKMIYRPNLWYWTGGAWGLADMALKNVMEDFRFLAENNCKGLFVDTAQENWATQAPQFYLMTQLAWDPYQDGQAVLDDYYRRGFGKAAEQIKAYWNLMEEAREQVTATPDYDPTSRYRSKLVECLEKAYSEELFKIADTLLQKSETLVAGEPDVYRKRVDFVRSGLEFSRLLVANIPLMRRVRESEGKDTEALEKVTGNWETIKKLSENAAPAAIQYTSILAKMQTSTYMGMMEDYFGPPSEKFIKAEGTESKSMNEPTDID